MTSFETIGTPSVRADGAGSVRSRIATELSETLRLATPLALTQLGQIAMMTTDLALIGRLGTEAVAGAALGQTVAFMSFVVGMGLVSAVAPLTAQAFGARDPHRVRRALRVGLWAAFIIAIPVTIFQLFGEHVLLLLGQAPSSARLASHYLHGMAWAALPGLWTIAIRGFMGSVNRPAPGLWIMLAAIPANALTAYALIYGAFGLPRLELLGAGLGTTIVSWGMCIASFWAVHTLRPFRKFHVLSHFFRSDWPLMRTLVGIGAPISVAFLLEYGLFGSAALLMGLISTAAITAHQVALNVAAILFMVPFGVGMAATVRVGQAIGRGDDGAVRRAGFVALCLGAVFMAVMTLAVLFTRHDIAELFLGERQDNAEAFALTSSLLVVGATFFIADGMQTVAAGALRGMSDTRVPMLIAALSYWLIGFVASCVLAFVLGIGAVGVWIGLSLGTAVYAGLLITRFRLLARRLSAQSFAA
jgi:MATE family multidrug resistance protein